MREEAYLNFMTKTEIKAYKLIDKELHRHLAKMTVNLNATSRSSVVPSNNMQDF
jgi:hypothetical protein